MPDENSPLLWKSAWPVLSKDGHKYDRGSVLILGGSEMTGAARLAARAAQRAGAGLVTIAAPTESCSIYAASLESVIVRPINGVEDWREYANDAKKNAMLLGPGLGISDKTKQAVLFALATRKPCVLDADALTSFADDRETLFAALHPQCVLTPHMGEFERLFGTLWAHMPDKADLTLKAAQSTRANILLKGSDTTIASPDGLCVVNHNAPPWLATAGAGDVLAGLILGLISQKMPVFQATCAGAWLHGAAAQRHGPGLIAEDLEKQIPSLLKDLS